MIQFNSPSLHLVHPTGGETELFFVRHGQTSANVLNQFAGSTDVPLDDLGRRQAGRVAERFRDIPIDAIFASPLHRAFYTAQQIGMITGHEPIPMASLQEMHFGDAEMLTMSEIRSKWPTLLEDQPDGGAYDFRWPNGESDSELIARVLSSIESVSRDYPQQRVAMVCHGGVISRLLNHLRAGERSEFLQISISNCSITHLSVSSSHTTVHYWNDHAHLDEVLGPLVAE